MQVGPKKTFSELRQGSIFNFGGLKFKVEKEKDPVGFDYFYREVDLKDIQYGIVVTQDCDCVLGQQKITHLNVGLLEPIDRKKKENPLEILDMDGKSFIKEFLGLKFYVEDEIENQLKQKMADLVDNKSAHFIFIEIESRFYYVNLAKIFPLKLQHYPEILANTEYELANGFNYLLGWKMANMFGRVGVDLYNSKRRSEITKKIVQEAAKVIFRGWPGGTVGVDQKHYKIIQGDLSTYMNSSKMKEEKKIALRDKILKQLTEFGYIQK